MPELFDYFSSLNYYSNLLVKLAGIGPPFEFGLLTTYYTPLPLACLVRVLLFTFSNFAIYYYLLKESKFSSKFIESGPSYCD